LSVIAHILQITDKVSTIWKNFIKTINIFVTPRHYKDKNHKNIIQKKVNHEAKNKQRLVGLRS